MTLWDGTDPATVPPGVSALREMFFTPRRRKGDHTRFLWRAEVPFGCHPPRWYLGFCYPRFDLDAYQTYVVPLNLAVALGRLAWTWARERFPVWLYSTTRHGEAELEILDVIRAHRLEGRAIEPGLDVWVWECSCGQWAASRDAGSSAALAHEEHRAAEIRRRLAYA